MAKWGREPRAGQTVTNRVALKAESSVADVAQVSGHALPLTALAGIKEGRCGNSFPLEWGAEEFPSYARGKSFPRPGIPARRNIWQSIATSGQ